MSEIKVRRWCVRCAERIGPFDVARDYHTHTHKHKRSDTQYLVLLSLCWACAEPGEEEERYAQDWGGNVMWIEGLCERIEQDG